MRWQTFDIQREPGFRLNLIDLLLILAILTVCMLWWRLFPYQGLYLLPAYVGISFFTFCNIFRIGNRLEAPWHLTFTALAVYGFSQSDFPWLLLLAVGELVKWGLIAYHIRRGHYVGAFRETLSRFSARTP